MKLEKGKRALVVAAHPDDEVLGAGGTMLKMAHGGMEVFVVYVATGVSARHQHADEHAENITQKIQELKEDARAATSLLQVRRAFFLDLPDNRLDTVSRMDIAHKLHKLSLEVKPDVVFTHHHGDYNWDHGIVHDASLMAFRADPDAFFPKIILAYEVPSATERAFQHPASAFCPTVFVNIKDTLEGKKAALARYRSEIRDYPHPRSHQAVEHQAARRGNEVGLEFAEAFQLIRAVVD